MRPALLMCRLGRLCSDTSHLGMSRGNTACRVKVTVPVGAAGGITLYYFSTRNTIVIKQNKKNVISFSWHCFTDRLELFLSLLIYSCLTPPSINNYCCAYNVSPPHHHTSIPAHTCSIHLHPGNTQTRSMAYVWWWLSGSNAADTWSSPGTVAPYGRTACKWKQPHLYLEATQQ